jgi:putative membrane protein
MSYLDDPRVFFAAERTMLAWQRTAVALIGLGFVIERFSLFMRLVGGGVPLSAGQVHTSLAFGVLFLVVGALVSTIAAVQFRRFIHELSHLEVPRGHSGWLGPLTNYTLALAALGMAAWFVASSNVR